MSRCLRCNDETHSRRKMALRDYTDSRALYHEGPLCSRCWAIVVGELIGLDVGYLETRSGAP